MVNYIRTRQSFCLLRSVLLGVTGERGRKVVTRHTPLTYLSFKLNKFDKNWEDILRYCLPHQGSSRLFAERSAWIKPRCALDNSINHIHKKGSEHEKGHFEPDDDRSSAGTAIMEVIRLNVNSLSNKDMSEVLWWCHFLLSFLRMVEDPRIVLTYMCLEELGVLSVKSWEIYE